ncbi:MAG: threonine--tRNA ligase [Candidatus Woykebacteria bacterium RBG_16_43_9]|uniref:Threonine--tRNA ligase n=1 Tax=Candidatus Woykebacteria bacterium RBG_16_43_9 TaxID=1802596 RepID=A0A1G1WF39_9BACT|nr:MAG: threonine--tRNA ligase [Candidatus Woykebacteria bacterium RBG_16_43_9]
MNKDLDTMRHSAAHLLAAAVKRLYPKTSLGIGPVIEDGFYYDFDSSHNFSTDDFSKIEKEIENLKKKKITFQRTEEKIDEATKLVKKVKEPYKEKLIGDLKKQGEKKASFYKTGEFIDLCAGPHVKHSGEIGEVKLLSVAGAYWRGNEKNKMLQRIYGTAWRTKKDLGDYLNRLEEAKNRDHKKLGAQLGLFTFLPVAPGMPFWYPKGFAVLEVLKKYVRAVNKKFGYKEISTPQLAKKAVWETSGHWKLFREDMFAFNLERQTYALKPMNCPPTLLLYNTQQHSYRDLPLKLSDLDLIHRYEDSGTLNGLLRVRELSQDDAHIFCTEDQIESSIGELLDMAHEIYKTFGFSPKFYLATRPQKALGDTKPWKRAESALEKVLKGKKVNYSLKEGEGSFYGPKIDLHIEDALERDWQLATIQLDLQMPKRFSASYTDAKGKEQTPIMIHRAILGSFERFLGILIEHYAGLLPIWLSPVQIKIIPIAERHVVYAEKVSKEFSANDIRVEVDDRSETMQAKIRDAQIQKFPYMIIVGDKERVQKKVSVRSRTKGDEGTTTVNQFVDRINKEVEQSK